MKTRIMMIVEKKIAAILLVFPTPRNAMCFSYSEDEAYHEDLGQL